LKEEGKRGKSLSVVWGGGDPGAERREKLSSTRVLDEGNFKRRNATRGRKKKVLKKKGQAARKTRKTAHERGPMGELPSRRTGGKKSTGPRGRKKVGSSPAIKK